MNKQVSKEDSPDTFPVVCLGASAGGLNALKSFFSNVPQVSGLAYVVLVHQAPDAENLLTEILQKVSPIPVSTMEDGEALKADHVMVAPPNVQVSVFKGRLQVLTAPTAGFFHPIDAFLNSMALDLGIRSVAIILSGLGSDGTRGVREIKANNGLVIAQSRESTEFENMPLNAVESGLVDLELTPESMPSRLIEFFSNPLDLDSSIGDSPTQADWLSKVFLILKSHIGRDFSAYKTNTIHRRIMRRMSINKIDSYDTYVSLLSKNPSEVEALFSDLLIGVTSFFRDSTSFKVLEENVLPQLIEMMEDDSVFRAWVPGCSTGEEAYSLGILIREAIEKTTKRIEVQIFGTDIDEKAIEIARNGLYPLSSQKDIGEPRLKRFFHIHNQQYQIRKEIRDSIVFSVQDVLQDPPFSRLNLLSCRNVLIYFNQEAQRKLLPLFHYTLSQDGILLLGTSESIGGFNHLFTPIDKKFKVFKRSNLSSTLNQHVDFPSGVPQLEQEKRPLISTSNRKDFNQLAKNVMLEELSPPAVLIESTGEILHVQGPMGKYLETPTGPPTHNILDLARQGLRIELSLALRSANTTGNEIIRRNVPIKGDGDPQIVDLEVRPLKGLKELVGRHLVVFRDAKTEDLEVGKESEGCELSAADQERLLDLEKELQQDRETHQCVIEELESANEELKSTNEELQSSNEELQSSNEEMESSKEELQSLNEEMQTVNSELQAKVDELAAARDDMRNLLNGTEIATIFVDSQLKVRRFTPEATSIVNLIPTDIGRPLEHVVSNLSYDAMIDDLASVLHSLVPRDLEVQTKNGIWYKMRIMPYRTIDNRIDGAILTFSFIDHQKKNQENLESLLLANKIEQNLVRKVFDMNRDPMMVLDPEGSVVIINSSLAALMDLNEADVEGTKYTTLQKGALKDLDIPKSSELKSQSNCLWVNNVTVKLPGEVLTVDFECTFIRVDEGHPQRILMRLVNQDEC
jgi:two-component system CheB/CheR fusion protein